METKRVALFVQCLVDAVRPQVAEAAVAVLERLGLSIDCPTEQTCCGQPAFNAGFRREARRAARRFVAIFETAEAIVCPSGSCVHMVRHHYPELLGDEPAWAERARAVAGRTFELSEFLVDVLKVEDLGARFAGRITYHDSCHLRRGLGIAAQPRRLLSRVAGLELVEMHRSDACCGFGGTFAVKYPEISAAMVAEKVKNIVASGADTVVGCDLGCLLHIGGALSRRGLPIRTLHLAEVLAARGGGGPPAAGSATR